MADAENQTLRYRELERKVVGITPTMLTKCLRELEADRLLSRTQYNTIPPTVEYSLAEQGAPSFRRWKAFITGPSRACRNNNHPSLSGFIRMVGYSLLIR